MGVAYCVLVKYVVVKSCRPKRNETNNVWEKNLISLLISGRGHRIWKKINCKHKYSESKINIDYP